MIISDYVEIKWNPRNKNTYIEKGYQFTKYGDVFHARVADLSRYSSVKVDVSCDGIECDKVLSVPYSNYLTYVKPDGKYYCTSCACKFGEITKRNKALQNGAKSFEQWCIENDELELLDRWDYELNDLKPNEITAGTNHKYYFKCPCKNPLHKSELKNICNYTTGHKGVMDCIACKSIGQFIIDEYGFENLYKYWSKNNIKSPFEVYANSNSADYIFICNNTDYHGEYKTKPAQFSRGFRCPYCHSIKIHPKDSLGQYLTDNNLMHLWSDKNTKDPFTISRSGHEKVWWKCGCEEHEDYQRKSNSGIRFDFKCPKCDSSMGEENIMRFLDNNHVNYEYQKIYPGLLGLGGGNLSYDFYLSDYNLLIEAQGQQHEKPTKFRNAKTEEQVLSDFKKQIEHDRRKKEYAKNNGIDLLEIWYWDYEYGNISTILTNYLNLSTITPKSA